MWFKKLLAWSKMVTQKWCTYFKLTNNSKQARFSWKPNSWPQVHQERGKKKKCSFLEIVVCCLYFSRCLNVSYCSGRLSRISWYVSTVSLEKNMRYAPARKCFSFLKHKLSSFEFLRVFFLCSICFSSILKRFCW